MIRYYAHPDLVVQGLVLTLVVAGLARGAGALTASGLWAALAVGGWVSVGLGSPALGVVAAFFLPAVLATRWRLAEKRARGVGEPGGGSRGAGRVLAKGTVGAMLAVAAVFPLFDPVTARAAFVGAFAAAAADTLGTEIGQVLGKRAFLLAPPGRARPGTEGAVSLAGSLAGLGGAALVAAAGAPAGLIPWEGVPWVAAAGLAGSLAEALLAPLLRRLPHRGLAGNLLATAAGAALAAGGRPPA